MESADVQDLPSMVYQLLILASRGFGRRGVVSGMLGFFGRSAIKGPPSVVRQVEGTVLMHVSFAVKQDPSLAQEVMGVVRSNVGVLSHFAVLVVMAIARVRRFADSAIGVLRSVVVSAYKDCRSSRLCKWIPEEVRVDCLRDAKQIESSLMKAVSESSIGREHVVPSLVQFCFVLLESVDCENCKELDDSESLLGVEELGVRMLRMLFEIHDMARNEIIEQCKFRILGLKPQLSLSVVKLLSDLVRHFPYPMLDHIARLKELLDYFTFMSDKTSLAISLGILPLIKFSHELQDYIILVVRKALFRREGAVRLAATHVIMELILDESKSQKKGSHCLPESSSQASSSQKVDYSSRGGLGLFHEVNGLLCRCLSQEVRIKEVVYHGLLKLVIVDQNAAGAVYEFLWPHFLQFYQEGSGLPLRILDCDKLADDKCYHGEPLDSFLSCITSILLLEAWSKDKGDPSNLSRTLLGFSLSQEMEETGASSRDKFVHALLRIRKALRSINLEDMFPHEEETSSRVFQGEKRGFSLCILCGITEVFINLALSEMKNAIQAEKPDLEAEVYDLINLYESLEKEIFLSKQHHALRKGFRKSVETLKGLANDPKDLLKWTEARKPFISILNIHQLLDAAISMYDASNICSEKISGNVDYCHKRVDHCSRVLSFSVNFFHRHVKSSEFSCGNDSSKSIIDCDINMIMPSLFRLAWLLKFQCNFVRGEKKKETKGKKAASGWEEILTLLSCLIELLKACPDRTSFSGLLKKLAAANVDGVHENDNREGNLEVNIQEVAADDFILKWLKPLYSKFLELSLFRECEVLSEVLLTIGNKATSELRISLAAWIRSLCRISIVENPKVASRMMWLVISLSSPPEDLSVAQSMASELIDVLGSETVECSEAWPIINGFTALSVCSELLLVMEPILVNLDWTLTKLKSCCLKDSANVDAQNQCGFGGMQVALLLAESLYSRSAELVYLLTCFTEMDLQDTEVETLLRLAAKFYKILARMAKFHIAPKGCKQDTPGPMFQKLVEVTCKMLTTPLYRFLAFTQQKQTENVQPKKFLNKIQRENKCIPDLIYQIEDYEKYLIKLGKITKLNLMRHAKRSTVRDFKIGGFKRNRVQEQVPEHNSTQANEDPENDPPADPIRSIQEEAESDSPAECESPQGNDDDPRNVLEEENTINDLVVDASEGSDDDGGMVIKARRSKVNKVVQDSDED